MSEQDTYAELLELVGPLYEGAQHHFDCYIVLTAMESLAKKIRESICFSERCGWWVVHWDAYDGLGGQKHFEFRGHGLAEVLLKVWQEVKK